MDWSRAKTVLIWAFLILNVLLGYQLWLDELNLQSFTENAAMRDEMEQLFAAKDIQLEAEVPEGTPILNEITVRLKETADPSERPRPLTEPFGRSSLADDDFVKKALLAEIPNIGDYEPDPYAPLREHTVYVMNQLHTRLPMFEMRLELIGEGDTVNGYRYRNAEVDTSAGTETSEGQQILSAYVVLGSLAEYYLPRGAVIADVRLGYHGPIFESDTQVLAPYWRIVLKTGETYYVHAVNGAVEGPSAAADKAEPQE